jgi:hypothetical protein
LWHLGGLAVAADVPPSSGSDALLALIGGVLIAVIGGVVTISVNLINKPKNTATSSSVTVVEPTWRDFVVGELAVLRNRADDHDEILDVQDRRLDHIERAKDHDHPGWRDL